eukprot:GHVU01215942.1.p1 GENE.GHVU01215942.1~~GHVU01215942.1.p1  ORF type:complete len:146 (-),score=15.92 GHVU01215942.1:90-527(-)
MPVGKFSKLFRAMLEKRGEFSGNNSQWVTVSKFANFGLHWNAITDEIFKGDISAKILGPSHLLLYCDISVSASLKQQTIDEARQLVGLFPPKIKEQILRQELSTKQGFISRVRTSPVQFLDVLTDDDVMAAYKGSGAHVSTFMDM